MGFFGFLFFSQDCECTRFCVDIPFYTVNVWVFCGFFVCLSEHIIRFGFAVLLLISLKYSSTRIAPVVFPFSLLRTHKKYE